MASLRSGLGRDDYELVHIETKQLTLVIKGKPYHEQYEGLKQYRRLDFHETMEFFASGEGVRNVKLFDVDAGALVDWSGGHRPIFFENGIYQLLVVPKTDRVLSFYHESPALRNAISRVDIGGQAVLMGNLHFPNEVGLSTFEIRDGHRSVLDVTIEIFPTKLTYKQDYQRLLDEVSEEIYNLAFHFIKRTYQRAKAKRSGAPSRSEFFRLMEAHIGDFLQAIRHIERQPHHQLSTVHVRVRGDQLGRLDAAGRNDLRKRPHVFRDVKRGIDIGSRTVMPQSGLKAKQELTYDTLENRFVKWMMTRLVEKLRDLFEHVQGKQKRYETEPDPDLLERIQSMIRALETRLRHSFWRPIGRLDRSVASLVLQMAPGYRDAYQLFLLITRGLALQGTLYRMSVKDVATLYEYWTFLKLGQLLGKKYRLISQNVIQVNRLGLFVHLDKTRSAKQVYEHPHTGERITLTYQLYEGRLPTVPQMPDTVLAIEKKGKDYTFNYIFDAKYRLDFAVSGSAYEKRYGMPGPMEDDINTMHRYRDSLVARRGGPYERTAFGAYVLFPWHDEDSYQAHPLYKSINDVNIGGLPFLPNATRLVEQFIERLIENNPEELQQEGILPQGIIEEWRSAFDEHVLVGMVPSARHYEAYVKHRFYHIPVKQLKKGWQNARYIALYPKQGAAPQNGVTCFGKITAVNIVKRSAIAELPKRSDEEYVRFEVESWNFLQNVIRPVGYGIAVYAMTTFNMLKQAKELPELFMKSSDEIVLWRILRRLSDRIRFDLDARYLDQASKITAYRVKNVSIRLESGRLIITNGAKHKTIPADLLRRQPSAVFREVVGMMGEGCDQKMNLEKSTLR
ncbi:MULTISPECIES: restriction endonuclease-like protein [Geobacillus]|uniref:DUF2357 domain-containing protein n=1 Tax=Geobacillus zalihae TaxID=213419 RepID=A0A7H1RWF1_9BACL|nr:MULTISPECIES: restriction endonuclease-like protein [Geobacillus]OQP20861.1 restriction endonuclease [Geobacillus zalihae]QNU18590.1 DUF2357 domain-containing protein [Geobacillus zalihae]